MDKQVNGATCASDPQKTKEVNDAMRLYEVIKDITERGCDAEVKNVRGVLKVLKVKKTEPITINIGN